jgi:F-type H+-transporting ATPase subunit b
VNITLALFAQSFVFLVVVWFCWKFIWPPVINAMQERQKTIAEGLAAAERAAKDLQFAQERAGDQLREAKDEARQIIEQARHRATLMIEEAKNDAIVEGERQKEAALQEIDQEVNRAKEALRTQVAALAVSGAERILSSQIDRDRHAQLLDSLAAEL